MLRKSYIGIRDYYYYLRRKPYIKELKQYFAPNSSIISSNCFAGRIYQDLGLKYLSPTLGLYFMYPDYINFLKNITTYLEAPIYFVNHSKYILGEQRIHSWKHPYPVGLLNGELEIHFLH